MKKKKIYDLTLNEILSQIGGLVEDIDKRDGFVMSLTVDDDCKHCFLYENEKKQSLVAKTMFSRYVLVWDVEHQRFDKCVDISKKNRQHVGLAAN